MRTLKTEIAGLPAGTEYEVIEHPINGRMVRWMQRGFLEALVPHSGRLYDGSKSKGWPIFVAHVAALGINPEEEIPCGKCGSLITACLTKCPDCECDPDAEIPCGECDKDGAGEPTGYIAYSPDRGGMLTYDAICPACIGERRVPGIYSGEREAALRAAKRWKAGQAVDAVSAGIGARP